MHLRKPALHLSDVPDLPQRHLHLPHQQHGGKPMSFVTANLTREEDEVRAETARQNARWGPLNYPDGTGRPGDREAADAARKTCKANGPAGDNWRDILDEEVREAFAETDPGALLAELLQVETVARQWRMAIRRRLAAQQSGEAAER